MEGSPVIKAMLLMQIIAIFVLFGCQKPPTTQLNFIPLLNGQAVNCDSSLQLQGNKWQLQGVQFYIAKAQLGNVQVGFKNATGVVSDLALVGGMCQGEMNWQQTLHGKLDKKSESFSFEMAVPFELNHTNPLKAEAPLNQPDMFWNWQIGHKFLRFDLGQVSGGENWAFHLGSTGCDSASVMRSATKACKFANRFKFEIKNFDINKPVYIHLEQLISELELTNENACMSDVNDKSCKILFKNLAKNTLFSQIK